MKTEAILLLCALICAVLALAWLLLDELESAVIAGLLAVVLVIAALFAWIM